MNVSPAPAGGGFERGTDGPLVIMVGLDGSPSSMRAVAYAAGLARRQRSLLVMVYVQRIGPLIGASVFTEYTVEIGHEIAAQLEADIRTAVEKTADMFDLRWRFVTRHGDPYLEIVAAAQELKADAVVVGVSESLGHRFAGSLATRLVRAGLWPVTVVP